MIKKIVFLVCSLLLAFITFKKITSRDTGSYTNLILNASNRQDVDPNLIRAVIMQESRFDPDARGDQGEIGLMQITRGVVKDWERENNSKLASAGALYQPEVNIEIGTWYLGKALWHWNEHEEDVVLALIQYNAGRQRALKWERKNSGKNMIEHIPFESTKKYVTNILKYRFDMTKLNHQQ